MNFKLFTLVILLANLAFPVFSAEKLVFDKVYRVFESTEHNLYVITNNGTWLLLGDKLVRQDSHQNSKVLLNDYLHLFEDKERLGIGRWQSWFAFGLVLLVIIFTFSYLYYQTKIKQSRIKFTEKIKHQQQILEIAFWATGDEILDCDLTLNTMAKLNKNSDFRMPSALYFQSEAYINKIHPEDRGYFRSHFEIMLNGGNNNYELNYRIKNKTGQWLWLTERGCVVERNEKGKALRLISCIRDISAMKKEQDELARLANELDRRLKLSEQ